MFILKYNISWSGGKDSTATIILAHELKIPINEIIYCRVMYNEYIPADLPVMTKFVDDSIKTFREWGYDVRIVTPKKTAVDLVYAKYKRSKCLERNGKYYGVTAFCRGHCRMSGLKQMALSKDVKPSLIGIAFDEPERLKRIRKPNRSLIAEHGLTEKDCLTLCRENDLLSPLYDIQGLNRGGCFFCPNANKREIQHIRENFPKLYNLSCDIVKMCDYDISLVHNNWIKEVLK